MIVIEKFSGLITNASRYALPGGAFAEQINIQCIKPGQLQVRGGLAQAATVPGSQVVSAVRVPTGTTEQIICQAGTVVEVVTL